MASALSLLEIEIEMIENTTSCSSAVLSYWNFSDSYRIRTWNLANVCIEMRNCCD